MENLYSALVAAQLNFKDLHKTTQAYNYKYATLSDVRDCVIDALTKEGLTVLQFPVSDGDQVGVETILAHKSGESISRVFLSSLQKRDPQAIGSVLTYYRRYGLMAVLGLAPDDDDDAQAAMPSPSSPEDSEVDPGQYRLKFGKFKGETLSNINREELTNWAKWMVINGKTDGPAKEALAAIKIYLSE